MVRHGRVIAVSQYRVEASAANLVIAVWSSGAWTHWSVLGHGDLEQDVLLPKSKVDDTLFALLSLGSRKLLGKDYSREYSRIRKCARA